MHVKEVPNILFREFVDELLVTSERNFAEEQGWSRLDEYSANAVIIGETEDHTFLRHGLTQPYNYLGVHGSYRSSVLEGDSPFRGQFSLIAGSRDTGVWTMGGGRLVEQTIWVQTNSHTHAETEDLIKLAAMTQTLGKIISRVIELKNSGVLDITRFNERDLET